ncbi:MAG TPA: vWA domain-containing protein [Saprospiraceae bacterium]|nr:vWA domain-containing protein [Saprospiraceae bacterium]
MKIFQVLFTGFLLILTTSCGKDNAKPDKDKEFELFIDFWNTQGTNPQIRFDAQNSSPEIKIDFSKTFAGVAVPPKYTNVIIDNVRLIDENNINYHINQIDAYEWRTDINDWKIDVEFVMQFDQVQDLAVILVLDASASLGDDFTNVKAFAYDFITKVFEVIPSAKIGIVDFSDEINSFGLTDNSTALSSYMQSIKQGPFTTLYEAMNLGIQMLHNTEAESKALLTFTDGTDNNSDPQYTPAFLLEQLNGGSGNLPISSFTIGLDGNGGVDKPVLDVLAVNGGASAFPGNINELESVFNDFSQGISTVYQLTYVRNQQVIPDTNPARLRFVLKASPKRS